nr:hypothetical protein [Tanacetum cinerariifolium]
MDHQYPTIAIIPVLDTGKFEQWQFRIQQYLQHEHYALWEVIEFGDSYKAPTNTDPTGRTTTLTTDDMQKKKNDVKARTTLLLSLLDEHQLRFSRYKTAKELWDAILKTFGGNEATKKRKKNLLNDLDSMSLDDLYNHLKVYEAEVQKKPNSNSQNMAFISSSKNSNNEDGNTVCVTTASTAFPTGSVNVATISQDTASAFIASQSNEDHVLVADGEAPTEFALMTNIENKDMAFISSSKNSNNEDGNTICVTTASTAFPTIYKDQMWQVLTNQKLSALTVTRWVTSQESAEHPEVRKEEGKKAIDKGLNLKKRVQKH